MKYPSYIRLYEASSPLTNWHIQEWNRSKLLRRAAKTFFAGAGGSKYSEIQKLNLGTAVRSMGKENPEADSCLVHCHNEHD